MDKSRELFVRQLGDVLAAEQMIVKMLPTLAEEAWDAKLTTALEKHLTETERHVKNVKAAFKSINQKPKAGKSRPIKALKKEHDHFIAEAKPNRPARDIFLTNAAVRTEHHEIAAYTGLITMADALGETKASTLLQRNLKQEVAALNKLNRIAKRLAKNISHQGHEQAMSTTRERPHPTRRDKRRSSAANPHPSAHASS